MPRLSKKFALLLVLAMLASMFVGMGTASAATTNTPLTVPTLKAAVGVAAVPAPGSIMIVESNIGSITAATYVTVTLPPGASFIGAPAFGVGLEVYAPPTYNGKTNRINNITVLGSTSKSFTFNVDGFNANTDPAVIQLNFPNVEITSGAADFEIDILDTSGSVSSGKVINGHFAVGGTTSYALGAPSVSQGLSRNLGTLRIVENTAGALNIGADSISLTLPAGMTWDAAATTLSSITGFGGTVTKGTNTFSSSGLSVLKLNIVAKSVGTAGIIDIAPVIDIDSTATAGDIVVSVGGTNAYITPATVVVGKYGEYGITASCANPTNIFAGRYDVKIGIPIMKENIPATLIQNRTLNLELPLGVVWRTAPTALTTTSGLNLGAATLTENDRVASFNVVAASAVPATATVEFRQGTISVPVDFPAGDLNLTFGGSAGVIANDGTKTSVKVATIVAPVALEGTTPLQTLIIGKQNQTSGEFSVVEAAAGAIAAKYTSTSNLSTMSYNAVTGKWVFDTTRSNNTTNLLVDCPAGVAFAALPEISVTGDLKIDTVNTKLSTDSKQIIIPIQTSSVTTASTISFANVKYVLDRTVPVGAMKLSVTGSAVDVYDVMYGKPYSTAAEGPVANVTTPAPGEENKTATFVVGESKYTLEGVEITMDVAPYIKDGRTFLPIAYVAQACGISTNNIVWDAANQTVTLMKGDKVVQLKIGSTTLLVNGAALTLDAAPEINNSRTCLPVALVARAFGESVSWDAATQTITITSEDETY
jgi:hypothetical protein